MRLRQWLFGIFREVAESAAFEEWEAPVLERQELYTRKAGDEIVQQMYAFQVRVADYYWLIVNQYYQNWFSNPVILI